MIDASIKGIKITSEIVKRFWEKVDVRSPDECWPWMAGRNRQGYGDISVRGGTPRRAKMVFAHRLAYTLVYGTIQGGEGHQAAIIRHKCDCPGCCNPFHLDIGEARDNVDDRNKRGRQARGENQGKAKLNEAQVLEIRETYAKREASQRAIARAYKIGNSTVCRIVTRRTWKHI